jgi:hypothetical protein
MRGAVFLMTVFLLAAGCGTSSGKSGSSRTTTSEPNQCRAGTGSPISEDSLKRAFEAKGIQLYRDDNCTDPDALVELSNMAIPYEQQDAVKSSEGEIFCSIYPTDTFGPRIERFVWRNDRRPLSVDVLNVGCALFPERVAHTDKVEQAVRQLPGVSKQSTTVPSEDAIHE